MPTVITSSVSDITINSATCGGDVTSDGGATVTSRGVCWSTSPNPTIADSHTSDGSGTGSYISSLFSLLGGTTYYVRAYAQNSVDVAYGNEEQFITFSLSGWHYIREITIDNTTNGSTLNNYQVLVIFDTETLVSNGKLNSNLSDIRFTLSDGTQLPYWIENGSGLNQPNSYIWVKISNILANSQEKIFLFYGNSSAVSTADGSITFDFFDDFNGSSLDLTKWTSGCFGMKPIQSVSITNSVLSFQGNGCGGSCLDGVSLCMNGEITSDQQIAVETRFKFSSSNGAHWHENQLVPINASSECQQHIYPNVSIVGEYGNNNWDFSYQSGTGNENYVLTQLSNTIWYKSTLIKKINEYYEGQIYDDNRFLKSTQVIQISSFTNNMKWVTTAIYNCLPIYPSYDWIFIRKYSDPEPATIVGNEQNY